MVRCLSRPLLALVALSIALLAVADTAVAFAPSPSFAATRPMTTAPNTVSSLSAVPPSFADEHLFHALPSTAVSAATVDPTSFLSNVLGGLLGSPAILLVPILAGISVAAVVAWFIVWSATPEVEDDEI